MESDEEADRVMAFRTGKAQEQRDVGLKFAVIAGQPHDRRTVAGALRS